MAFMQKQITSRQQWYAIETTNGTEFVSVDDAGVFLPSDHMEDDSEEYRTAFNALQQFCEGEPLEWETRAGYGCRLSAPGYLDRTEWNVFDSVAECNEYLNENFPEDEDGEAEADSE